MALHCTALNIGSEDRRVERVEDDEQAAGARG